MKLKNYAEGRWIEGTGGGKDLFDAATGEKIACIDSTGLDFDGMMHYARTIGNPTLRKMSFQERGLMLKKLALFLFQNKDRYYELSYKTGATRKDSWIDIEGGIGTLFAYASLRRQFADLPYIIEGEAAKLSPKGGFIGQHILVPREGVAIHINAFNFPIWGMLEKCSANWMAGLPAIVKPASVSSFLTHTMTQDIIQSNILPPGALQLICGSAQGILDFADSQDVISFTGSAATGQMLKSHPNINAKSIPFNLEVDSLNCSVLGHDATPGTPEYALFIKEVVSEITVKCGQKCTAIRRIIVPQNLVEEIQTSLKKQLSKIMIGDPRTKGIRMGALASMAQLSEVRNKISELMQSAQMVYGNPNEVSLQSGSQKSGAFISPVVLRQDDPLNCTKIHEIEAFGPVSTIMPYQTLEEAIQLSKMGKGSLCCSIISNHDEEVREFVLSTSSHHGRILVLNRSSSDESTGHGSPLPMLIHGGPGRAGGGQELGGVRGVKHYMQRCAIQASPTDMTQITKQYQLGSKYETPGKHVFQKYFEDLEIGETIITHKRTIVEADISNFANLSWDHFYAHTDATSLDEDSPFEKRVAHGYFILAAAAGLFVHPAKGPVILNYGIENCRFTKPVYAGMTIGVRLTVKEKIAQERKEEDQYGKGIVKFLVDVYDETQETVAIATILTMVRKRK